MSESPILNIDDVEYTDWGHGEQFQARLGAVATRLGAQKLGYRVVELPPGKCAWPFHAHHVNEEMFFVVEGSGTLRYGDDRFALNVGDIVCCPPKPQTAHQIINTSQAPLKYLAVSTMEEPEVAVYPDSDKFGVIAGAPPGVDPARRRFVFFGREQSKLDYWDGE